LSQTRRAVLDAALELEDAGRARLAEGVLRSLDTEERARIEQLWYAEACRRLDVHARGEVRSAPADEVFAALLRDRTDSLEMRGAR
jgi:hypothetical protein